MECRDLYDENKKITGKVIQKGDSIPNNLYYLVVIVLIENETGQYLIQRRSNSKGGLWALTGGHPKALETSKEGMITEIREELGLVINPNELFLVKTLKDNDKFVDIYYLKKDIDINDIILQKEEVQDIKWFSSDEVESLITNNLFHKTHSKIYCDIKDYFNKKRCLSNKGTETLETERLILRKFALNDYKSMYENWCHEEEVTRYVPWYPHKNKEETKSLVETWIREYEKPNTYNWIVLEKDTNQLIGSIGVVNYSESSLRAEVGYCYGKKWWGKGYGTEALKIVINYLTREVGFEQIICEHLVSNPASGKVMEKAGMKYVGILPRWHINKQGLREDIELYTYIKD